MRKGWIETTLGEIATLSMGRTPSRNEKNYWTDDLTYPFCTIADMDGKFIFPNREGVTNKAIQNGKAKIAPKGTLLMSFKLTIGRMGFAGQDIYPNEAIVSILPNSTKSLDMFLYYLLGFQDLTAGSGRAIKGETLNSKSLSAIPIYLPPPVEQKRIVDVVSSVDAYIDALQQQADSARVVRNAVLYELLSAGGTNWTETTLGEVSDFTRGPFGGSLKKEIFVISGYAVFEQQHAIHGDFDSFRYFVNAEKFKEMSRFKVSAGDLIMSCSGTIGKVSIVPPTAPQGIINQALLKISPKSQIMGEFLLFWTQSEIFKLIIGENSGGAVQQNVASVKILKNIAIALPPIVEQERIVEIVSSMDDVIQSTEQAVVDAEALRSGLLSDLLSGNHEIPASYDSLLGAA